MTPEQLLQRGTNLIQEFAPFNRGDMSDIPEDISAVKLWAKAKLHEHGFPAILDNKHAQASIEMAVEAAYRIGKLSR